MSGWSKARQQIVQPADLPCQLQQQTIEALSNPLLFYRLLASMFTGELHIWDYNKMVSCIVTNLRPQATPAGHI